MATSISEAYFPSEDEEDSEYNAGSDSEDGKFVSDSGENSDGLEGKDAKFPQGYPLYAYPAGLNPQTPPRRATSRTSKQYAYPLLEEVRGHNSSITSGQPDYDKKHRVRHWVSYASNNTSEGRHEVCVLYNLKDLRLNFF